MSEINTTLVTALSIGDAAEDVNEMLFADYPGALLHLAAACCLLFMFLGIPGNLITVIALFRYKKVRNATAVFIMNLSVSDLMFCCFNMPLAASLFWTRAWTHGQLLCRLFPLMRYGLLAVSLFSILAITINRYVMIGHPRLYPRVYRKKYLACMVGLTWICGFGALVPTWFGAWGKFGLDTNIGSCSILHDDQGRSPKQFLFVIAFLIPCIFIVVCYARIFYIVRKTAQKSRSIPRNNVISHKTNNSSTSTTLKNDSKISTEHRSQEDSAIGTLSTGATITDKSSAIERFHCSTEGTSYLVDESSFVNEANEKSPKFTKSVQYINNNGEKFKPDLRVRSNPNLLALPSAKIIRNSDNSIARSLSDETVESLPNKPHPNKKLILKTNKSYSVDQIIDEIPPTSEYRKQFTEHSPQMLDEASKKRRCSSLALVANIFRNPVKNFKPNHKLSMATSINLLSTNSTPGKMSAKDKKILKMILVIFLSFLTCYLPITIAKAYSGVDSKIFNIMGYILIYLTPCINPLIYVVMSSEYRQAYKNLLMCRPYGIDGSGRST